MRDAMNTTAQDDFRHGVKVPYLRAWRMYRLLSQAELSERAHLSVPGISLAENGGKVRLSTLVRLAMALDVPREALVRTPPPPSMAENATTKEGLGHAQG
jgi:transcriptional regulator with XRE-family HTH domain